MNYAIIEGGKVENVAVADAPLADNWIEVSGVVGPGWFYVDGEFLPPPPRPANRTKLKLSFSQLLIGLVTEQWISAEEGRAWRDRTALPPAVAGLIATLPEEQRFAAETRAIAFTEALRLDPLVEALGAAEGKTPEELDQFFLTYSNI
jgi:hypothetical protein